MIPRHLAGLRLVVSGVFAGEWRCGLQASGEPARLATLKVTVTYFLLVTVYSLPLMTYSIAPWPHCPIVPQGCTAAWPASVATLNAALGTGRGAARGAEGRAQLAECVSV